VRDLVAGGTRYRHAGAQSRLRCRPVCACCARCSCNQTVAGQVDTGAGQVDDVALEGVVCSQLGAAYDECLADLARALDYQVRDVGANEVLIVRTAACRSPLGHPCVCMHVLLSFAVGLPG
jgi:hypothetical protein